METTKVDNSRGAAATTLTAAGAAAAGPTKVGDAAGAAMKAEILARIYRRVLKATGGKRGTGACSEEQA